MLSKIEGKVHESLIHQSVGVDGNGFGKAQDGCSWSESLRPRRSKGTSWEDYLKQEVQVQGEDRDK